MPEKLKKYEADYAELAFESILRKYRQQNVIKSISTYNHQHILEIGCGFDPLFNTLKDFEKMIVLEPGEVFYKQAVAAAEQDSRIRLINNYFENTLDELQNEYFDCIIIGGFLHEIENPNEVLQAVKKLCNKDTNVHSYVPNAHSFHRLLAYEMGLIKEVFEKSANDDLFNRYSIFDIDSFQSLFTKNGFEITECGTYFMKLFTYAQLESLVNHSIIDDQMIEGLNKITKYFKDNGAEIYINCKLKD